MLADIEVVLQLKGRGWHDTMMCQGPQRNSTIGTDFRFRLTGAIIKGDNSILILIDIVRCIEYSMVILAKAMPCHTVNAMVHCSNLFGSIYEWFL